MTATVNVAGARRPVLASLAIIILASFGTTGCQNAEKPAAAPAEVDAKGVAEEAFIYGYPIVMNYGVMYQSNIDEKSSQFRGGLNKLVNIARVFTPADTSVVTPNSDTPYSMLQLDLRAEPMVICVPKIPKERYYSVQLVDMYSFNYGYIGSRVTGNDAGCFMVAGPSWVGQAPAGIKQTFKSETQFGLTIFRTQLFNAADIDNVKAVQAGYSAVPLSTFTKTAAPAASPAIEWPAIDAEKSKSGFFNYLSFVMQFMPPVAAEAETRAKFAAIGLEAGKPFDIAAMPEAQQRAVVAGMKSGLQKIEAAKANIGKSANGWNVGLIENNRAAIAGNWLQRSAIANAGIYANDYQEALYPMAKTDQAGAMLDGSKASYTITFAGNAMPPVNAFWSVTMYDGKTQLLIDNPIDRYLINSPMLSEMIRNADGGVTLHVSKTSPGKDRESNWLPAPNGPIYMVMRLYWPKDAIKDGSWQPPVIVAEPVA